MTDEKVKCPKCNTSRYIERGTIGTSIHWEHIYEDGKLVSKNPNTYTTSCKCLACGQEFDVIRKEGKELKIVMRED